MTNQKNQCKICEKPIPASAGAGLCFRCEALESGFRALPMEKRKTWISQQARALGLLKGLLAAALLLTVACGTGMGSGLGNTGDASADTGTDATTLCGNGMAEVGEICDGSDLRDQTCLTIPGSYSGGVLACRPTCTGYVVTACTGGEPAVCGNDRIEPGELCDGTDLADQSCTGLGLELGTLHCDASCHFDTSGCGAGSECGNGTAEEGELCDGTDLRGADCTTIGLPYGVLACTPTCTYDIGACYAGVPVCGNGVVEENEECDDGNGDVSDACPDGPAGTCQDAMCGDGYVWAGVEGCDDGNGLNGDLCPDGSGGSCELATCGDGFVFVGAEVCDPSGDPLCNADCQGNCGDGVLRWDMGERCEPSLDPLCRPDCTGHCADGAVNGPEECEITWVGDVTASCDYDCTLPVCGDGICNTGAWENQTTCAQDCGTCGDGVCDNAVEDHSSCPADCVCPVVPIPRTVQCDDDCYPQQGGAEEIDYGNPALCCPGTAGPRVITKTGVSYALIRNCGSCGNNCPASFNCRKGVCCDPSLPSGSPGSCTGY